MKPDITNSQHGLKYTTLIVHTVRLNQQHTQFSC